MSNTVTHETLKTLIDTINGKFDTVDERFDFFQESLKDRIDDSYKLTRSERDALKLWFESRFDMVQKRFEDYQASAKRQGELMVSSHLDTHRVAEGSFEDFKLSVQQRLDVLTKAIEVMREERGYFVLRDSHDAQVDALEKFHASLERSMSDKIEGAVKQLRDAHDLRIAANLDKLVKIEQNMQVMNARNQQSIIALGILLTLVEIIIRFYQKG